MGIKHTYSQVGERYSVRARKRTGEIVPQVVPLYRQYIFDTNKYAPDWLQPPKEAAQAKAMAWGYNHFGQQENT